MQSAWDIIHSAKRVPSIVSLAHSSAMVITAVCCNYLIIYLCSSLKLRNETIKAKDHVPVLSVSRSQHTSLATNYLALGECGPRTEAEKHLIGASGWDAGTGHIRRWTTRGQALFPREIRTAVKCRLLRSAGSWPPVQITFQDLSLRKLSAEKGCFLRSNE